MPGARVVGQFDDGPSACQHAEKPFQIRSVGMTSKSVVDTRLTAHQSGGSEEPHEITFLFRCNVPVECLAIVLV